MTDVVEMQQLVAMNKQLQQQVQVIQDEIGKNRSRLVDLSYERFNTAFNAFETDEQRIDFLLQPSTWEYPIGWSGLTKHTQFMKNTFPGAWIEHNDEFTGSSRPMLIIDWDKHEPLVHETLEKIMPYETIQTFCIMLEEFEIVVVKRSDELLDLAVRHYDDDGMPVVTKSETKTYLELLTWLQ